MKLPRILIAAPKSGSGKTMITCGLMQCYKNEQKKVQAFKCGPDYIDPMFHETVLGIESENLDTFFYTEEQLNQFVPKVCKENQTELAVIEGVMGLYDGIGGGQLKGSAYHVASCLKTPVILVVDTYGMADSILALLAGFLQFDENKLIRGFILNRMSKGYYEIMKPLIEERLSIPVLGYVPVLEECMVESRHLGLKMPHEIEDIQTKMQKLSLVLSESLDLEQIYQIASKAEDMEDVKEDSVQMVPKVSLAVAMDEAFCFYYKENFRLLRKAGVEIVPFSPLHDEKLPEGVSGILLGGGYPENYLKELSANTSMRASIYSAISAGMPSLAECGGFMYLHDSIVGEDGQAYPMAGLVKGSVKNQKRLVRFGYINVSGNEVTSEFENPLIMEQDVIRGHEFHYYDSEDDGRDCIARRPNQKGEWECIHQKNGSVWGFPHLYYGSNKEFVERFVHRMKEYQGN